MAKSYGLDTPVYLVETEIFRTASPENKLTPRGYLDFLLNNNKPRILSDIIDDRSGYIRDIKYRFMKRVGLGTTVTTDDCSIQAEPAFFEGDIPSTLFRKKGIFFDWKTIERFSKDALAMQNLPASTPPTQQMQIVIDTFKNHMNGLLGDINDDLLTIQAANFGVNVASGSNAAKTLNFAQDTSVNNLSQGWTMMLADLMANEVNPNFQDAAIVGSGLINNFYLQQGYNPATTPNLPQFYNDTRAQVKWGANHFGVFQRDSVQFINICRFRGAAKSGDFGTSRFGTLKWPVRDSLGGTGLSDLEFDFQAREIDCPTEDMIIGSADPKPVGRGVVFDLMCSYQQVNVPSDGYEASDPLFGSNGTFRYIATNV